MFFQLGPKTNNQFPCHSYVGHDLWLSTDHAWHEISTVFGRVWLKGYVFDRVIGTELANELIENPRPHLQGSFVAVIATQDKVIITNDRDRATPIWIDGRVVGNIGIKRHRNVWADAWVEYTTTHGYQEHRFDILTRDRTELSMKQAVSIIHEDLVKQFEWLGSHQRTVKVFFSGGIDTLTCVSYLRALGIEHELVFSEHFDYDRFTCSFMQELREYPGYWGYQQIHHWREPTWLVTGGNGDENFMRGPTTANVMLRHLGLTMEDVLKPEHYHYDYFRSEKNLQIYNNQATDIEVLTATRDKDSTDDYIIQRCANDHQHWHLGNTLTFTPFKSLDLLKTVLRLDRKSLVAQITNAELQRELIRGNDAELLEFLVPNKNSSLEGMYKFYSRFS